MGYHVFDGNRWSYTENLVQAGKWADEVLDAARDACDPEWPAWAEDIVIVEGPASLTPEDLDEAPVILIASEVNPTFIDDGSGPDCWCDYLMRPPGHQQTI